MIGNIIYLSNAVAHIKVTGGPIVANNLMNMHIIFEENVDGDIKRVLGEAEDINDDIVKVNFLGEIVNNRFIGGVLRKPTLKSIPRVINEEEIKLIVGEEKHGTMVMGTSSLYNGQEIRIDINDMFNSHLAIFGNSGSGKSCGVARLLQNVFRNPNFVPYRSNFLIFDAYGEYHTAFRNMHEINPNFNFKYYTTNIADKEGEKLNIPIWLLGTDDLALLLAAESHSQLPIIERMVKLTKIFAGHGASSIAYKNHLIAKAIMTILYTNQTSAAKRNDIFAIIANCSTEQFNLEAPVRGVGYVRKFRECFTIDTQGQFSESVLMTEYISSFINDDYETLEVNGEYFYTLEQLEDALEFTLISEGLLRNEKSYNDAITLKVRLHTLTIGENARYFRYPQYINRAQYIASLVSSKEGKAQIINFNLEDVEDSFAKVVTKIFSKMLFDFTKGLKERASIPFHIFLEEAHRYVQEDNDRKLIGYNIFERIAKEGRKYGLIFNLISQRPVEISETVISQCANFVIFKMTHPRDLEYIEKMLPNISEEVVEKQKSLQPGTCVAFGKAFKVPMIIKMEMPSPEPSSSSADLINTWEIKQ